MNVWNLLSSRLTHGTLESEKLAVAEDDTAACES